MSALGILYTIAMGILTLLVPRRHAAGPLLLIAFTVPLQVKLMVGSLDFSMVRIIIIFCWMRIFFRGELKNIKFYPLDYLFIIWGISNLVLYQHSHNFSGALTNRLGYLFNAYGTYFFFRSVVKNLEDISYVVYWLAAVIIIIGLVMPIENFQYVNMFGKAFGVTFNSGWRGGEIRCFGPFASPILAGTFGATAIPLFAFLWVQQKSKRLLILAGICAISIVEYSSSSGPKMSLLTGCFALFMWKYRDKLKKIRWTFTVGIVILHFIMTAPVWYLMSRLSGYVGGGTGWHRSELITQALAHFDEWWLSGTAYTRHWMPYGLPMHPEMTDITNHYLVQGVHGGLLTMLLFILVVWYNFKYIGKALEHYEGKDTLKQHMVWTIGAAFFAHCVTFMAVSYFDQIIVIFYMLIAFTSALRAQSDEAMENL